MLTVAIETVNPQSEDLNSTELNIMCCHLGITVIMIWRERSIILRKAWETDDVDAYSPATATNRHSELMHICHFFFFEPEERNCSKKRKNNHFPLIIDIMSDIVVFTDVQPVHICLQFDCFSLLCCCAVCDVALLFLLNLYLTFTLLFKVIIYNLIPTIFLVLSIKLI